MIVDQPSAFAIMAIKRALAMSTHSPTDAEAFYQFLGQTLSRGQRETPPEALLRNWRAQREHEETVEAIREGLAQMEAGLGKPFEEFDREFRQRNGLAPRSTT
jgi:hypothetical protein